ncbi:MAG TPA: N-acetylmuramoyl-L-alanine amidase, partial [Tepidisphaeraceae bacterium]|nr:N-acetylmuramoyl-L-alanine amidase [Tepidisphaeraceae bacterium]
CITICLVGDFDRSLPTPAQMRRLTQLVTALQGRLRIPAGNVMLMTDAAPGAAGTGRYFPTAVLKDALLP